MNWKAALKDFWTTASGVIGAAGGFVLFTSVPGAPIAIHWPQWAVGLALFASVGGLAGLGITARSYSGGQTVAPAPPMTAQQVAAQQAAMMQPGIQGP